MIYFLTVNYDSTDLIAELIKSIQLSGDTPYQIVIVNNSPDDGHIYSLKSETVLILETGDNLGFGNGCNVGLNWIYAQDSQAVVWLINPDACLIPNSLENIDLFFDRFPEISILGTIIYTPSGTIWFAGGCFIRHTGTISTVDLLTHSETAYISCEWVSGCSLLVNFRNFQHCPQFDPAYFLYYEDFDFCRHYASLGHIIGVTQQFGAIHQPSTITNRNIFRKIQHSTYSYLLTLERYTNQLVLLLRLTRLLLYAILLVGIKPKVAFGKLYGILLYLKHRCHPSESITS